MSLPESSAVENAPPPAKKKRVSVKKPVDIEAGKYRDWEKQRRLRFNLSLETLAKELPNYEEERGFKWSKMEILEKTLDYIKVLKSLQVSEDLQKKIKGVKKQNQKLREIIRQKCCPNINLKDFSKLNLTEITESLNGKEVNKENSPLDLTSTPPADHSYSRNEEGAVKETTVDEEVQTESSKQPTPIVLTASQPVLTPSYIIRLQPPPALFIKPLNDKLPLPRLRSKLKPSKKKYTKEVKKKPIISKEKEIEKKDKKNVSKEKVTEITSSNEKPLPSTSRVESFELTASSTLPDAILATEDPMVEDEDFDELSSKNKTCKENTAKEVPPAKKTKEEEDKNSISKKSEKPKTKSKSSYSIAALCQISVNIGGDPPMLSGGDSMVNSPGMISLNSIGTASPSVTPAPPSPPLPLTNRTTPKVIEELKPVEVIHKSIPSKKETSKIITPPKPSSQPVKDTSTTPVYTSVKDQVSKKSCSSKTSPQKYSTQHYSRPKESHKSSNQTYNKHSSQNLSSTSSQQLQQQSTESQQQLQHQNYYDHSSLSLQTTNQNNQFNYNNHSILLNDFLGHSLQSGGSSTGFTHQTQQDRYNNYNGTASSYSDYHQQQHQQIQHQQQHGSNIQNQYYNRTSYYSHNQNTYDVKKTQQQHNNNLQTQRLPPMMGPGGFSVNQLVSSGSKGNGRKSGGNVNKQLRDTPRKSQNSRKDSDKQKVQAKSVSSSRSSKYKKGNYSAESLLMDGSLDYNNSTLQSARIMNWEPSSQFCSFPQDVGDFAGFGTSIENVTSSPSVNNKTTSYQNSKSSTTKSQDTNFFPIPTLTPPTSDEAAYFGSAYSTNNSHKQQNYQQHYKHFSSGRYPDLCSNNQHGTGSLVNFNLSTIFPEINSGSGHQHQGVSKSTPSTSTSSTVNDFRQSSAPSSELIPHSIASLGQQHQGSSVPFSGSGFNFPPTEQQQT